jgi:hypothetical protein
MIAIADKSGASHLRRRENLLLLPILIQRALCMSMVHAGLFPKEFRGLQQMETHLHAFERQIF